MSSVATLAAPTLGIQPQLPTANADEAPVVTVPFIAPRRRPPAASQATDTLHTCKLDGGPMTLARRIVLANLSRPDLSPGFIAGQMQVSRATLYRLFEPEGGVMHFVRGQRLEAVHDALADPMEKRTISRLAEAFAFSSNSQLSRSFRNRYGVPPQAWRGERRVAQRISGQGTEQHVWKWLPET